MEMSIISWLIDKEIVYLVKWGVMREFYIDTITFISQMEPLIKALIIGILLLFVVLGAKSIVSAHVNAKKPTLKIGTIILEVILVALTIFVCIHAF